MAGKRLLDIALLVHATRTVARHHIQLRSSQLDVWTKTSTIAKAILSRADRFARNTKPDRVVTRLHQDPSSSIQHAASTNLAQHEQIPSADSVRQTSDVAISKDGIQQDHHYGRSEGNTAIAPVEVGELSVAQAEPKRNPSPDGSIPPLKAPIQAVEQESLDTEVISERRAPAAQADLLSDDSNNNVPQMIPESATTSSIPEPMPTDSTDAPQQAVPEQETIPEGINTDVFHTPRVKRTLGETAKQGPQGGMPLQGPKEVAAKTSKPIIGDGQDTFNVRMSGRESSSDLQDLNNTEESLGTATTLPVHEKVPHDIQSLAADIATAEQTTETSSPTSVLPEAAIPAYSMRESRVPATRFGRLWEYSGLATSMAFGAVGETFRRATGGGTTGPLMLSGHNMERLVNKLSRMRGAALKLGQMMSFQDSKMLPAPIAEVLQRVQDNADYMPPWQRDRVLATNLGGDWRSLFSTFEEKPMAAASIGQVHRAVLASTGADVAVKIQYPGVADSISSDLNNLSVLLTATRLLPKGLYLDKTIANARTELAWECDYEREANCQERFRSLLVSENEIFTVPAVFAEASGKQVLTAEFMHGLGVTKAAGRLSQEQKDWIGTHILRLCLRELTEFHFMQTDPNWTNFLYNSNTNKLELLDFGAARDFPREFVDPYVGILIAASKGDRESVRELSVQLGYLTGHESATMVNAHLNSVMVLAEPFSEEVAAQSGGDDAVYDFRDQTITDRVRAQIPIMLKERLAPPPEETYSLHRKLSGAFLMLAKLESRVKCRDMFLNAVQKWEGREHS